MALGRGALGLGLLSLVVPLVLLLVPLPAVLGEECQAYIDHFGNEQPAQPCPYFCCGSCKLRFCCSNVMLRFDGQQFQCNLHNERFFDPGEHLEAIEEASRKIRDSMSNNWLG